MTHSFSELIVGGVLLAPFVRHVVAAFAIFLLLGRVLHLIGVTTLFSHPSIAAFSLYVTLLGLVTVAL
jgi:hypothetical protein